MVLYSIIMNSIVIPQIERLTETLDIEYISEIQYEHKGARI
jgi:hypothetical protein